MSNWTEKPKPPKHLGGARAWDPEGPHIYNGKVYRKRSAASAQYVADLEAWAERRIADIGREAVELERALEQSREDFRLLEGLLSDEQKRRYKSIDRAAGLRVRRDALQDGISRIAEAIGLAVEWTTDTNMVDEIIQEIESWTTSRDSANRQYMRVREEGERAKRERDDAVRIIHQILNSKRTDDRRTVYLQVDAEHFQEAWTFFVTRQETSAPRPVAPQPEANPNPNPNGESDA